jgi:adhesin/invasin
VGVTVNFAATAGTLSAASAVTTASGEATVSIKSLTASPATVQATLTGGVSAEATLPIQFVAETPNTLVLQVNPTAIAPNASGSVHQAEVLATVTDANANPVKGVTVNFNRTADPSGGNLSSASQVTDSSGQASVQ